MSAHTVPTSDHAAQAAFEFGLKHGLLIKLSILVQRMRRLQDQVVRSGYPLDEMLQAESEVDELLKEINL